ncbi:type II secretion system protein [Vibrio sinensis]|uniref:Type II secretion system protein n=1 Tax=Vibrio sinensis TaxID=2302434 RepID=A0A3A6Q9T7_9VIBR|nr:type II secretion system protein [Vibrio sinensis]RJX68654.1 type II secretion system protein [Vibrio sinensis]
MPRKRKQGGYGLLDVLLALSLTTVILLILIPMGIRYYQKKQVDEYVASLKSTIVQMQLYQYHKTSQEGFSSNPFFPEFMDSWPASFDALMLDYGGAFKELCGPLNEAAGACVRPDTVPFTTQKLTLEQVMGPTNKVYLVIPTSTLPDDGPRARWGLPLLAIPEAQLRTNGDIQINLRPLTKSIMYDEFLRKDGSVHLTNDWDVGGNHAIVNTKDVTILNSDSTQKIVSRGLSETTTLKHGEWLKKPSCPTGTEPRIWLALGYINVSNRYTLTGSQKPFIDTETTTHWEVGLEVRVENNETGEFAISNDGEILAITQCK